MIDTQRISQLINLDPEIMSGTPVFMGTRVPVKALFDYLGGGENLDEFLDDFPTVNRAQAIAVLDLFSDMLLSQLPVPQAR